MCYLSKLMRDCPTFCQRFYHTLKLMQTGYFWYLIYHLHKGDVNCPCTFSILPELRRSAKSCSFVASQFLLLPLKYQVHWYQHPHIENSCMPLTLIFFIQKDSSHFLFCSHLSQIHLCKLGLYIIALDQPTSVGCDRWSVALYSIVQLL